MQFKHPELLYALFLLLIPIIVHLFQLRKFKKVAFTNVAFLKEATLKTRKSSQVKKWLILCTRLLLLAAIVLAFAQPLTSKTNGLNIKKETVIYLDNSFSMQAKGLNGELLKRAVHDLINNVPENENISLFTNNTVYKNTTIKAIKNDLLQLDYTTNNLTTSAALLKSNTLFSTTSKAIKNTVLISDFQIDNNEITVKKDSLTNLHFVKLQPVNTRNIAVDSAYVSNASPTHIELTVHLTQSGNSTENVPISLFNNENLIAKTSVEINDKASTTFSLPLNEIVNGKLTINDAHLQFDNSLYFNINTASKINVLSINGSDDSFLKRMYNPTEFNYTSTSTNQLKYNLFDNQHLIILNELNAIPNALVSAIKAFTNQGGSLIVIPSKGIVKSTYNALLLNYATSFNDLISNEKRITTINYSHPLYSNGVFEKQVRNFQYPKVNSFYNVLSNGASKVLSFEDDKAFLYQNKNAYIFTSALNTANSNLKNSPLIVPTFYNIAKFSFKIPQLYYTIGEENRFDVDIQLQQDDILSLVNKDINLIPKQQSFNNKVVINTSDIPTIAGTYAIKNKAETIANVSYNYNRNESNLVYSNLSNLNDATVSHSITEIFDTIKSDSKINALWKWFVIFALLLLLIEMLILKYFK
ncbi:BatA domain-containing protein [Hwangdonia lutea]|uniref:BatA domain-containing protein n=1 Tax=Hwangdonia lutea TaxID=3075823 RepID=A0AA97HQL8_9FLAO|nr:BatA domain-containing protein [Hwangdonia sp. SCSIO 19198]WOD44086.1 BatA domain-containing protein [Hwangdonia sp. SCSIO 19198]